MIKFQIRALSVGCAAMVAHSAFAVGNFGFVPTDTNVISPTTSTLVQSWKQVGSCNASAVQISPSWILSANHAGCVVGLVFKRMEDGVEQASEVVWSKEFPEDLRLSRLKTPLPYKGEFVPLASGFPHFFYKAGTTTFDTIKASTYRTDVLAAGYGNVKDIGRRLQVGWAPVAALGIPLLAGIGPGNPHMPSFPIPTDGDSGGGMFLINDRYPSGALAGLMQSGGDLPNGTKGFRDDARATIESVLSDPLLNPTGERVNWIDAASVLGSPSDPLPETMQILNETPSTGWVTSSAPGTLRIQYPKIDFRHDASTDDKIDQYVIRLVHESHLNTGSGYDFSTTVYSFINDYTIGSGIKPGNWFMTVNGRVLDPQTGRADGFARRVAFRIPENTARPQQLSAVNIAFERLDFGDGLLHWCANLTPVAGNGTPPEGVIWTFVGKTIYTWFQQPWKMPMDQQGGVCDIWRYSEGAATPGELFQVTAQPYNGAAVGPTTTVNITAPASLP